MLHNDRSIQMKHNKDCELGINWESCPACCEERLTRKKRRDGNWWWYNEHGHPVKLIGEQSTARFTNNQENK